MYLVSCFRMKRGSFQGRRHFRLEQGILKRRKIVFSSKKGIVPPVSEPERPLLMRKTFSFINLEAALKALYLPKRPCSCQGGRVIVRVRVRVSMDTGGSFFWERKEGFCFNIHIDDLGEQLDIIIP